jgi:hypothetical protein
MSDCMKTKGLENFFDEIIRNIFDGDFTLF